MKAFIIVIAFIFCMQETNAQINFNQFNQERLNITKNGMLVLGSWGIANIAAGVIGMATSQGETKYFHQMNLIWGAVNFAIAAPTYFSLRHRSADLSAAETVKEQSGIEKTFVLNAGLDLVYITAGAYCIEKANNDSKHDLYKGYGKSLFVQGGGLLLFDVTMAAIQISHAKKLYKLLSTIRFSGNNVGIFFKI